LTVREATLDDVATIQELWRAFEREIPPPDYHPFDEQQELREIEEYVAEDAKIALVAENDDRVVGFALARLKGPRLGYLSDLYVAPDARRTGIASALVREAVERCRAAGAEVLELDVQAENAAARSVYEHWGLRPTQLTLAAPIDDVARRLEPTPGETFGAVHVQTDDRPRVEQAVAKFIPRLGHSDRTDVSEPANGWVRVDDELCSREPELLRRLARELSYAIGAVTLALGVERAVVRFVLFDRGRVVDEYLSVPEYFGELPPGDVVALAANPTVVARLTGADATRVRSVARTASSPAELPPARELLQVIAETLGVVA
jgi:ribosomal protein S18 acetylase RimI-like enzyme